MGDRRALVRRLAVELDEGLLELALTHRSYAHEAGGIPTNERLEFLGDSVLGLVVTEYLFRRHPDVPEGDLAKMRAATVSQRALASIARELGLGGHILLGRGEVVTRGAEKDSILSDTLEAIIGAIYLSHGLEVARGIVERLCAPLLADARRLGASLDWKTTLQEIATLHSLPAPVYAVQSSGPDHDRTFTATATVGEFVGTGVGSSKKVAEHGAAEAAYDLVTAAFATDGL
ncbi:MAG: ribonuclease III [bacterium]|nr:ribonuclease III [bacterium]